MKEVFTGGLRGGDDIEEGFASDKAASILAEDV